MVISTLFLFLLLITLVSVSETFSVLGSCRLQSKYHCHSNNIYENDTTISTNPSYFPRSLTQLAQDASFSSKVALINRYSRIRIDVRTKLTSRRRNLLKWLVLLAEMMLDDRIKIVYVFLSCGDDVSRCKQLIIDEFSSATLENRIQFRSINETSTEDISTDIIRNEALYLINEPDNVYDNGNPEILEHVQTICFHAALRSIPVIITNPTLVSTSWNDFGPRNSLLLSDFRQVYLIRDDFMVLNRHSTSFGIVYRISLGFDLFVLTSRGHNSLKPETYVRVKSWANEIPNDFSIIATDVILKFSDFLYRRKSELPMSDDINKLDYFSGSENEDNEEKPYPSRFSWREIRPPPSRPEAV